MFRLTQDLAKLIPVMTLGTLCGCGGPVYDKLFSTEHFDYYVEQGVEAPCDEAGEWLERYYAAYAKFLGAEPPPGEKIEYYVVGKSASIFAECGDMANGCVKDGTVYAGVHIMPHEIAHANAFWLGDPPLLFKEGIAVVMSCTGVDGHTLVDTSPPLEDWLESSAWVQERDSRGFAIYPVAASFVRFLIDVFGVDRFLAFYAHTPGDASSAEIKNSFKDEFGVSLDSALSDWRTHPDPLSRGFCLRLMECDTSAPVLEDGAVKLGCGPSSGTSEQFVAMGRFRVNSERTQHIVAAPAMVGPQAITQANIYHCSMGSLLGQPMTAAGYVISQDGKVVVNPTRPTRRFILDVPEGDYFASFASSAQTQIGIEMTDSTTPMRNGCTPATEPLVLRDTDDIVLTSRWMDRPCSGFWCPGHSWDVVIGPTGGSIILSAMKLNGEMPYSSDTVYLCSEPCPTDASKCEAVSLDPSGTTGPQSKQVFAPGTIVHMGAPLAPLKEHFSLRMRLVPPCNGRVPCTDPWHGPR